MIMAHPRPTTAAMEQGCQIAAGGDEDEDAADGDGDGDGDGMDVDDVDDDIDPMAMKVYDLREALRCCTGMKMK